MMAPHPGTDVTWSGDISWHPEAACEGIGNSDEVWFMPPDGRIIRSDCIRQPEILAALDLCWNACPVRELCWQQAASDRYADGVWGGEFWPSGWNARQERVVRGPLAHPNY